MFLLTSLTSPVYLALPAHLRRATRDGGQAWLLSGYERFATCLPRKYERAGRNDIWYAVSFEKLNVSEILFCRGGNNIGLFFEA